MATQPPPSNEDQPGLTSLNGERDEDLSALVRELGGDVADLARQQLNLARLELQQAMLGATRDAMKIVVAFGLTLAGGACLVVFGILGLGRLLDGAYWAGALIVGGALLLVGGLMIVLTMNRLRRRSLVPRETASAMRRDALLAREGIRQRGEKVSSPAAPGRRDG
jgi:Putative Actinobacterial Holin-X, holin superfamily III